MGHSSLKVLNNQDGLSNPSQFLKPLSWADDSKHTAPRALRSLAQIIENGLCHRCGSCVGICPTKTLGVDDQAYPSVLNLSACTDCDLCVKVCPGDKFDFQLKHQEMFGTAGQITETHGSFIEAAIAYATDSKLREASTSGGLVTGLLIHLLETKQIDGAIVIAPDEDVLWKGKPVIARSVKELLNTAKSKYAISPTNTLLTEIRETPGSYALVGLPCQIHGLVKAADLDERIRERVKLTIALCCHAAIEHEAYKILWESFGQKAQQAKKFISRVGKHPGTPHLELADGSLYPVYFGAGSGYRPSSIEVINILYRLYTPARCLTCFDAMGEFADIAVGDPWMAPPDDQVNFKDGWSFSLIRTNRGQAALQSAIQAGKVFSKTLTRREALACNELMSSEKRWRAFRVIETQKRQGKAVPIYGEIHAKYPKHSGWQFIKTELHMLSHIFCFIPQLRPKVLRFFLGQGYWLFWLNSKRRALRFGLRDLKAKLRRSFFGRK